ncbi:DUF429 domain-containing protein [Patescibacteria group bacterium]|nr:DUF429 domain-containing protein [Patescibacteria group bacterium]
MTLACGIDLGLRPKTALAFVRYEQGKFVADGEIQKGLTDEAIERLIESRRPDIVAIDAPLSARMEEIRPAEKELRVMLKDYSDVFYVAGTIGSPFGLLLFPITYRGMYLRDRLQGITELVETHPLIDFLFLDGDPANAEVLRCRKSNNAIQYEILRRYVQELPDDLDDDELDAVMCAFIACVRASGESDFQITELSKLYDTDPAFIIFSLTS